MTKSIASLLRRIVGRANKVNTVALSATLGVMALPLGVYLLVEGGIEDKPLGIGMMIVGWLLLTITIFRVWQDEKREKEEKYRHYEIDDNRFELQTRILAEMLEELKRLNNRGNRNERSNKDKQ